MLKQLLPAFVHQCAPVDPYLRDILRHMLGAWPDDSERVLWGRRNYFMAGPGRVDDCLRKLLVDGLVRVGSCAAGDIRVYHATPRGCLAIGLDATQTRRALEAAHQVEIS
ncbi:hypothetical protein [Paraburkholderia unamae]|uniref:Uncharacterized protein n=1 Tax=Paraburkholderia unamae TaxID=219649 RepID=A0ABX5KAG6_9BURK|nr:hypothetical protein [Paraburkholderia unamae]PVX70857.1 hypothetical protein C7402_13311 [Paraburkholderia unamae]